MVSAAVFLQSSSGWLLLLIDASLPSSMQVPRRSRGIQRKGDLVAQGGQGDQAGQEDPHQKGQAVVVGVQWVQAVVVGVQWVQAVVVNEARALSLRSCVPPWSVREKARSFSWCSFVAPPRLWHAACCTGARSRHSWSDRPLSAHSVPLSSNPYWPFCPWSMQ